MLMVLGMSLLPPRNQCLVHPQQAGVGGEDTSPDALRVSAAVTLCTISTVDCLLEHVGQCAGYVCTL